MAKREKLKGVQAHTRYYTQDGKRVPGVTTITGVLAKPALIKWAHQLGLDGIDMNSYRDALADVGTCVHHMILCDVQDAKPMLDAFAPQIVELAENAFLSYLHWRQAHAVRPILCERPLVSEEHRFGGTPDLIAEVNSVLEVVDFKSGSGVYTEHFHQVGGGYLILAEEHGYKPERVRIVRIPRDEDEGFEDHERGRAKCEAHREMFLLCRRIYELQSGMRQRDYPRKNAEEKEVAASG